eukprot:12968319-Ditylum_brightwellii.AAC.1
MSLDIDNMYLSIQVKLIKRALAFYSKKLLASKKGRVDLDMCMVQIGMKSTLVNFQDKRYIYWGVAKGEYLADNGVALAIGSYESTFLVDLVASFIFKKLG